MNEKNRDMILRTGGKRRRTIVVPLVIETRFDVLVMATRDRRDPVRWVSGSVADYLVQRAPIPVLLVR